MISVLAFSLNSTGRCFADHMCIKPFSFFECDCVLLVRSACLNCTGYVAVLSFITREYMLDMFILC